MLALGAFPFMLQGRASALPRWVSSQHYKKATARPFTAEWFAVNAFYLGLSVMATFLGLFVLGSLMSSASSVTSADKSGSCDTIQYGYRCQDDISHYWGQYSPYFSVPSEIPAGVPLTCSITFAQILSRHGARDPTASKTTVYNETIAKIHASASKFTGKYAFLADYKYTLGADQLTTFGQQEMVNSGIKFYEYYESLSRDHVPFVRTSGEARVVESAQNWTQGFAQAKDADITAEKCSDCFPRVDVVISEDDGSHNTLNHGLCTTFEDGPDADTAADAQAEWASIFVPPIQSRLNAALGTNLSVTEIIYVMDLCPFETVASPAGQVSAFCALFTQQEWQDYGYYETLNKFYGFGTGNPLGPTQGVGFTNELIARLTGKPVVDHTSTNRTLDDSSFTFPLGRRLFADFSHDNDMTAIFFALGLYNETSLLSNTSRESTTQTHGYSAAWTVPFAARAYFEKLQCIGYSEELVRVIVNDRVLPLHTCGGDALGRCTLNNFVESLSFAEVGGDWNSCFI